MPNMISQNFPLSFPMSFCSGILIIRYILSTLTSFDFYLLTFVIIINYFYLNHFFLHFNVTGYVIKFWEFIGVFTTNSVCYCYFYFVNVMIFLQFSGKVQCISGYFCIFDFAFRGKGNQNLLVLRDILITYSAYHQGIASQIYCYSIYL